MLTRRQRIIHSGGTSSFVPSQLSAVVGWLQAANATITGSGVSSLPDTLGGPAATQGTDANRPSRGTSSNGLSILEFDGTDFMFHPLDSTVNNNSAYFGLALWFRSPLAAVNRFPYTIRSATGGASVHRVVVQIVTTEDILVDLYQDNTNGRRGRSAANAVGDNVWQFWTFEHQGSLSGDARFIVTRNNSNISLTYSDFVGSLGAVPAALPTPTGNAFLGSQTNVPAGPFIGDMGPNIFFLNRQLTSLERSNLMNFEAPT